MGGRKFSLDMGYTIDHLTALMLVIVTTVAVLVMVYTDGYMAHDPGYVRFYAYLSLFSSLNVRSGGQQTWYRFIFSGTGWHVFVLAGRVLV